MRFLIALVIFPLYTFAQENCPTNPYPELTEIKVVAEKIEEHAANHKHVRSAFCTRKDPFTAEEMDIWLSSNQSDLNVNMTINGIGFEDESPENLESFRMLTTALDIYGKSDPSRQQKFSSAIYCKKVECAIKNIFGQEEGKQLLFMHRKFGMNGSHLIEPYTAAWSKQDLDALILSLSDFPSRILPLQVNKPLVKSTEPVGSGTIADSHIRLFTPFTYKMDEEKRYALFHEMGHFMGSVTGIDGNDKWLNKSQWQPVTTVDNGVEITDYKTKKKDTLVSTYAGDNEKEDWAESVAAYRYRPSVLKQASPEKYALIKEIVFDNIEYTSEVTCQNPKRMSDDIKGKVQQEIEKWKPTKKEITDISKRCNTLAIQRLGEEGNIDLNSGLFQSCYKKAIHEQGVEFMKKHLNGKENANYLGLLIRNAKIKIPNRTMKKLLPKVHKEHKKTLESQLKKALASGLFCDEDNNYQYAGGAFNDKILGVDSFEYAESFSSMAKTACAGKKKLKSGSKQVKAMLK